MGEEQAGGGEKPRRVRHLVPQSGKGKELQDLLRRELGIPDSAKSFEVRFAIQEPVTVRVVYMPCEREEA